MKNVSEMDILSPILLYSSQSLDQQFPFVLGKTSTLMSIDDFCVIRTKSISVVIQLRVYISLNYEQHILLDIGITIPELDRHHYHKQFPGNCYIYPPS